MTPAQLDLALRWYCRRRPFRSFAIEFNSGTHILVPHPEAVDPRSGLYIMRRPDGDYVIFAAESVSRLLDVALAKAEG